MSKRVLVVEDQKDLRGVLRDPPTGSGYAVIEAGDGEAGVAKAKSNRPDLILMDHSLGARLSESRTTLLGISSRCQGQRPSISSTSVQLRNGES